MASANEGMVPPTRPAVNRRTVPVVRAVATVSTMLLLLVACAGPSKDATDDTSPSPGDSDSAGESAPPDSDTAPPIDVTFSDLAITEDPLLPTTLTISWTTDPATVGYLEYGDSTAYGRETLEESEASTSHSVTIPWLGAGEEWHFRAHGDGAAGADATYTISVPDWLPDLSVDGDPDAVEGYLLLPLNGSVQGVAIVDGAGRYVWWREVPDGFFTPRALLTRDGASIVYTEVGEEDYGPDGRLVTAPLDGSDATQLDVPYLSHDFVELPDGTYACITKDLQHNYVGDRIVEYHPDGSHEVVWSAFNYFNWKNYEVTDGTWTHANALRYDESEDAWYLSLRNFDTLLKADRASRTITWRLMYSEPNFAYTDGAIATVHQHGFELLDDGHLLVFDNREEEPSRVVEYAIDETAAEVTEAWSYTNSADTYVYALGNPKRLDGDRTFINWATDGSAQIVESDGTEVWSLRADLGVIFGYAEILALD